jgi:hypothetical protein
VPASLDDHSDPQWIAKQRGFEVGKTVSEKANNEQSAEKMFAIFAIADKVQLQQVVSYSDKYLKIEVGLHEFLQKWQIPKAALPVQMKGEQQRPDCLEIDSQKALIFQAIMQIDSKPSAAASSLVFWRKPDEIRTSKLLPAHSLVLAPVVGIHGITTVSKALGNAIPMGKYGNHEYFVMQTKPAFKEGDLTFPGDAIVAAFWWVSTTNNEADANMKFREVTSKSGLNVTVMENHKDIEQGCKLWRFKAKEQQVALQGVTVLEGKAEPKKRGQQQTAAAKKARK